MARHVVITLDTTAPLVTWGEPSGRQIGQTLRIPISVDEPEVVNAWLVDRVGNEYEMLVSDDELEILVPEGFVPGNSHVRALTRDDVLNEAVRRSPSFYVLPVGVEEPVERRPDGFGPIRFRRRRRRRDVKHTVRSRVRALLPIRTEYKSRIRTGQPVSVAYRGRVTASRPARIVQAGRVGASLPIRQTLQASASAKLPIRTVVDTHRGPSDILQRDEEEAMLILDLL